MSEAKREPRAHHYVPECWLSGFTETGESDGRLWVTDLKRKKQWQTTPANAGHSRDFYRLSAPYPDPVAIEQLYSKIESTVAPILRTLDEQRRGPNRQELDAISTFIAIQWSRVPAFRPKMLEIAYKINRNLMARALKSPATWEKTLRKVSEPLDSPGADYNRMREFVESGQYSLTAETDWYIKQALESAQTIAPSLLKRYWQVSVSQKGSFIASDNPVALEGERGQMVGFANAGVVIYAVSRHVVLHGTGLEMPMVRVTEMLIARLNTLMMLKAHEQVFSSKPNYCWLDHTERYQTDWTLFDKTQFESLGG